MSNGLIFCEMNKCLSNIQGDSVCCALLGALPQDAKAETIDIGDTEKVIKAITDVRDSAADYPRARIVLITNLNNIFYMVLDVLSREGGEVDSMFSTWIFENHTRLSKMVNVALVTEGANLRSIGGTPEIGDIPQCLPGLTRLVSDFVERHLEDLRAMYDEKVKMFLTPKQIALYTGQESGSLQ